MEKVAVDLNQVSGKEALTSMLKFFVPPLTREINDDGAPEEVRNLAQEVGELIKGNEKKLVYPGAGLGSTREVLGFNVLFFSLAGMVGTEAYCQAEVAASRNLAGRRRDRTAARKADSVIRPERTAQLRIKKHLAKRVAKKMKVAKFKGKKLKIKKKIENKEK
jgi:hypothetical protein